MKNPLVWCAVALLAATLPVARGAEPASKAAATTGPRDGDRLAASAAASAPADTYKLTDWDALIPKDWDPMKAVKGIGILRLAAMGDADPKAMQALNELKRAWDNAPSEPSMDNARIRIPGFVVPLDAEGETVHEFLLVPYFGACIHTPPPPANQVVHVTLATPAKGLRMMDAVWVSGQLHTAISDTGMGTAGYRMDGVSVAPYRERR